MRYSVNVWNCSKLPLQESNRLTLTEMSLKTSVSSYLSAFWYLQTKLCVMTYSGSPSLDFIGTVNANTMYQCSEIYLCKFMPSFTIKEITCLFGKSKLVH